MHAYNESYLDDAMYQMGEMLDYGINSYHLIPGELWDMFTDSDISRGLSCGNPKYIAGRSGYELFADLIYEKKLERIELTPDYSSMDRSPEYWAGFSLAYYQWYRAIDYAQLNRRGIRLEDVISAYILHEAPIDKFVDFIDSRLDNDREQNMLRRLRAYSGMTQRMLSERSGVSLRMIQLYEQGQNDLSKAQAHVVLSLAQALDCDVRDLIS